MAYYAEYITMLVVPRKNSSRLSSNSEANASELLDNLKEMVVDICVWHICHKNVSKGLRIRVLIVRDMSIPVPIQSLCLIEYIERF